MSEPTPLTDAFCGAGDVAALKAKCAAVAGWKCDAATQWLWVSPAGLVTDGFPPDYPSDLNAVQRDLLPRLKPSEWCKFISVMETLTAMNLFHMDAWQLVKTVLTLPAFTLCRAFLAAKGVTE